MIDTSQLQLTEFYRALYKVIRGLCLFVGVIFLVGLISQIASPSLAYDRGPTPPLPLRLTSIIFQFLVCLGLVLPNRLTLHDSLYTRRMIMYGFISVWIFVAILLERGIGFLPVEEFHLNRAGWGEFTLSFILPLTLYVKKKINLKN